MNKKFAKGVFIPNNKNKYMGKHYPIYRSKWEWKYMHVLDNSSSILEWMCEPFPIVYFNPVKQKMSRYYPDFLIKYVDNNGDQHIDMIEIKPYKQTIPPINTGKKRKSTLLIESYNWAINNAKWDAAKKYCASRNITFKIFTEKELF